MLRDVIRRSLLPAVLGGLALGLLVVVACTGTDPVISMVTVTDAGDDAAAQTGDAGTPPSADGRADAGSDAAVVELLVDPSFEEPGNCAKWTAKVPYAKGTATPIAHDGVRGCLVCPAPSAPFYSLTQYIPAEYLADGGTYVASAWVRAADGGDVPPGVTLDVSLDDEGKSGVAPTSQAFGDLSPDGGWTQYEQRFTYVPVTGGRYIEVEVINRTASTGCFIVDEASFTAEPR